MSLKQEAQRPPIEFEAQASRIRMTRGGNASTYTLHWRTDLAPWQQGIGCWVGPREAWGHNGSKITGGWFHKRRTASMQPPPPRLGMCRQHRSKACLRISCLQDGPPPIKPLYRLHCFGIAGTGMNCNCFASPHLPQSTFPSPNGKCVCCSLEALSLKSRFWTPECCDLLGI